MIVFVRALFVADSGFFLCRLFCFLHNDRKVNYDCRVVKAHSGKLVNCKTAIADAGSF